MSEHFLTRYGVDKKPEAMVAAKRKERLTGQKGIVADRSERIQAYLERLERIFLNPDPNKRAQGIRLLMPQIYANTISKDADIPDTHGHFAYQAQLGKNMGLGEVTFDDRQKQDERERIKDSQKKSLDAWIEYLTGEECKYPADLKYFVMQGVLKLGTFDTEKYVYTKRVAATTAPFAEIDREALSKVLGALNLKHHQGEDGNYPKELLDQIDRSCGFGEMYAKTMQDLDKKANKEDLLPIVEGKWRTFAKGSDPRLLVRALEGKRSNLCIADIGSASTYLSQGSMDVYFSYNRAKQLTLPRVAVAYSDDKGGVYEVRGTYNKNEDTDPYLDATDIVATRLDTLPNGRTFAKKAASMKQMTALYKKCVNEDKKTKHKEYLKPALTRDELRFLYEFDGPIKGFGYGDGSDPRVEEIRSRQNRVQDLCVIFACTEAELEQKSHITLRNTPTFSKLPAEHALKKDFRFDWIWKEEYRKDRPVTEFALTDADLAKIGVDEDSRAGMLAKRESLSEAKVFDIGDAIRKKKQADPGHSDYLSTKEVLEAIDETGYRPATLQELLAYGRDYWKPDVDSRTLTDEEKILQHASASYIYALGSPFTHSDGHCRVPSLLWYGGGRSLSAYGLDFGWGSVDRFLVLRK